MFDESRFRCSFNSLTKYQNCIPSLSYQDLSWYCVYMDVHLPVCAGLHTHVYTYRG